MTATQMFVSSDLGNSLTEKGEKIIFTSHFTKMKGRQETYKAVH